MKKSVGNDALYRTVNETNEKGVNSRLIYNIVVLPLPMMEMVQN